MTNNNIFCQLILEDCIKHMATMADDSVNLILTDPPYNISSFSQNIGFQNREDFKGIISDVWDVDFKPVTLRKHFERILAPKGNIVCFTSGNLIGDYYAAFNDDFTTNLGAWVKSNPPPRVRKTGFLAALEHIMFFWKRDEPHTFNFTTQRDMVNVWYSPICQGNERIKNAQGKTAHPTQKPLKVLKELIEVLSNPGDVVFDPFSGVFSTGHAALSLGRSFIGTEITPYYFKLGEERLRSVKKQPSLF